MNRIAVYCGSSSGDSSLFKLAATELGALIATQDMALVYGGARIGLMGAVADAALAAGGEVIGVIPEALTQDEVVHSGLTHLEVVGSMHERKARMLDLADAAVAMPGGLGTLDELFEALTWAQLRFHAKPIGMLNIADGAGFLVADDILDARGEQVLDRRQAAGSGADHADLRGW